MNIICHRGFWNKISDQNSLNSLKRALDHNFSLEFDIRDSNSKLVISHNITNKRSPLLEKFFEIYQRHNNNPMLAINIKSDGISSALLKSLKKYNIKNYNVFDMSFPEQVIYSKKKINFLSRVSDLETIPLLIEKSQGLWIDNFKNEKLNYALLNNCMKRNKKLCFISPELHKRNHIYLWNKIKRYNSYKNSFICTDLFLKADKFFNK